MSDELPIFTETGLDGLWAYREEWSESEEYAKVRRRHADAELIRRAAEAGVQILDTTCGPIDIVYSSTYSYNTAAVDNELYPAIKKAGLEKEWNQFVSHFYKISKVWLNRLLKRGPEFQEIVEHITNAPTGNPRIGGGPSLTEMRSAGVAGVLEEEGAIT